MRSNAGGAVLLALIIGVSAGRCTAPVPPTEYVRLPAKPAPKPKTVTVYQDRPVHPSCTEIVTVTRKHNEHDAIINRAASTLIDLSESANAAASQRDYQKVNAVITQIRDLKTSLNAAVTARIELEAKLLKLQHTCEEHS